MISPIIRALTWFHRWSSILLCLLFALWFASGAVMLFVPFPSLPQHQRLTHSEAIDLKRIDITPAQALQQASPRAPYATALRLVMQEGQPVYLVGQPGYVGAVVDAHTGAVRANVDVNQARSIAAEFSGARVQGIESNIQYDQWIVHQGFDGGRPFHRVSLDDAASTVLYISERSGEVQQLTTRKQRLLNLGGAVMHWIYFTPIRKDWSLWNQLVWWLSLAALIGALVGMFLGIYRFVQARRAQRAGFGVYKRWLRWHHILGVCAGAFLLTWIFSGWLSMDHDRLFSTSEISSWEQAGFSGKSIQQISSDITLDTLRSVRPATTEIQFAAIAERSFMVARDGRQSPQLLFADGSVAAQLPDTLLMQAGQSAWPDATIALDGNHDDDLYARAEDAPSDARLLLVNTDQPRRVYVDRYSGDLIASLDASRRAYAWFYYALHTYKFPGLAQHDTLRIGLMLVLLTGGFALSVTGVVIAIKHLFR